MFDNMSAFLSMQGVFANSSALFKSQRSFYATVIPEEAAYSEQCVIQP